jgi:hypothetical protein
MRPATLLISAILLAALAAMAYGIVGLTEVGTCASGGPYVSTRECPDGTGTTTVLVAAGATVYCLATIAAAFRSFAAGTFWFGLLFTVLGATFIYAQLSGRVDESGGGVAWFLGALFGAMGVVPLIGGAVVVWRERHRDDDEPAPFAGPYVVGAVLTQAPAPPGPPAPDQP